MRRFLLCLIAALLGVPATAVAGLNAWTVGAQQGGVPHAVTLAGDLGLLATDTADFRSTDAGQTWSRFDGLQHRFVNAFAVDPAPAGPVYAATRDGVWRSFDHGDSWSETAGSGDARGGWYTAAAIDRGRPGTAFFVRSMSGGGSAGVYRATMNGIGLWTDVSDGLGQYRDLDGVVVDPFTHIAWGWRYSRAGVFTLADGATTWVDVSAGLTGDPISVTIDPLSGRVLAGTTQGVYSTSGAAATPTWTAITGGLGSTTLYTLALSTDSGGVSYVTTIDNDPARRVWRLGAGATSWTALAGWQPIAASPAIVADSTIAGHALAVPSYSQLWPFADAPPAWRTTDGGLSWTVPVGINGASVNGVAASPTVPGLVLAATTDNGVLRSVDGGRTWVSSSSGLPGARMLGIQFDPFSPSVVLADAATALYRSTDAGRTWALYGTGAPAYATTISFDPHVRGLVYALASTLVSRSLDGGQTWAGVSLFGIPGGGLSFSPAALAPDLAAPGGLLVAGRGGLFRLPPGEMTFSSVSSDVDGMWVRQLAIDPLNTATMLVGIWNGGIYRTVDSGAHWARASAGIPDPFVSNLAFDPTNATIAYATNAEGVYRSTDGGSSWKPLVGGLDLPVVGRLAFDADGHTVYAATSSIGVVQRSQASAPAPFVPRLAGKARVGSQLAVGAGSTAFPAPAVSAIWQRCDPRGKTCKAIAGAKGLTYRLRAADRGKRIRAIATLTNPLGKATGTSKPSSIVR
jgi:photosystem II stability/assembly factor-like uncharacterized protein